MLVLPSPHGPGEQDHLAGARRDGSPRKLQTRLDHVRRRVHAHRLQRPLVLLFEDQHEIDEVEIRDLEAGPDAIQHCVAHLRRGPGQPPQRRAGLRGDVVHHDDDRHIDASGAQPADEDRRVDPLELQDVGLRCEPEEFDFAEATGRRDLEGAEPAAATDPVPEVPRAGPTITVERCDRQRQPRWRPVDCLKHFRRAGNVEPHVERGEQSLHVAEEEVTSGVGHSLVGKERRHDDDPHDR